MQTNSIINITTSVVGGVLWCFGEYTKLQCRVQFDASSVPPTLGKLKLVPSLLPSESEESIQSGSHQLTISATGEGGGTAAEAIAHAHKAYYLWDVYIRKDLLSSLPSFHVRVAVSGQEEIFHALSDKIRCVALCWRML